MSKGKGYSRKHRMIRNRVLIISFSIVALLMIVFTTYTVFQKFNSSSALEDSSVDSDTNEQSEVVSSNLDGSEQSSALIEEDSKVPPVKDDPNISGHFDKNNVFIYNKAGYDLFYGTSSTAKKYADTISSFKSTLGKDVSVYNMIIPNHTEFGLPEKYKSKSLPQKENINKIASYLSPDIKSINAYNILSQKRNEYIYFNTDHHWTALGSYYAYIQFAKALGYEPLDITKLEKSTIKDFRGSFYTLTKNSDLKSNPDYVDYYNIPGEFKCDLYQKGSTEPISVGLYSKSSSGSVAYSVFIYGDNPQMIVRNSSNKNGKKIAIVKESYGNAFVPFLAYHYEEVHVIDSRHFKQNAVSYIKNNGIKEVIFLNNIMAANTGVRVKEISTLMTR